MGLCARAFVSFVAMALPVGCQQVEDQPPMLTFESVRGVSTPEDASGVPLEGAQLCQMHTDNCALSDANGRVSIELPIGEETAVTLAKEGYLPYLFPLIMDEAGRAVPLFIVESNQLAANQYERVGSPYPMGPQGAVFVAVRPPSRGATFDLLDATGVKQFYLDEEGWWDPNLEATTSSWWGGFTEVNPGVLQAEVGGMASSCSVIFGWPADSDSENTVRFPVREGHATWVRLGCR